MTNDAVNWICALAGAPLPGDYIDLPKEAIGFMNLKMVYQKGNL